MRKHRGLSAVVGTVFLVVTVVASLSYVTYSMNLMGDFSESLIISEKRLRDTQKEIFQIESIEIIDGKLTGNIANVGDIPLEIKSIWIEEDDSPELTKKFDVSEIISAGNKVNLVDLVDFDMVDTTGYTIKVISNRGNSQTSFINSVGESSLYLTSNVYPPVVSTEFDSTIAMTVVNNSTIGAPILNLTPSPLPIVDTSACAPDCSATYVSGPTPASFPNLHPGESVTFSWVYTVAGSDADQITFTTSLLNGLPSNTVDSSIEVRDVQSSLESGTALTSLGLDDTDGGAGVLMFHTETFDTPINAGGATYQMATTTAEVPGEHIDLSTDSPANFFLQNSSDQTIIPAGDWEASLRILHEHLPDSLAATSGNNQVDVIYHFNSDVANEPDSSGNNHPLEVCGTGVGSVTREQYAAGSSNPIATATFGSTPIEDNLLIAIAITRTGNSGATTAAINGEYVTVDSTTADGWTKIAEDYYYGSTSHRRGLAMWYKLADASEPTSITARWDNSAGTTNLRILEFSVDNNNEFTYDVSSTANSGTSYVDKQSTGWTASTTNADALTILAAMSRDISNFDDWRGNTYNTIEYQTASMNLATGWRTESSIGSKESEVDWHSDDRKTTAAIAIFSLTTASGTTAPTYVASGGPDNSPYYSFDGVNDCFESQDDADNDQMDVDTSDNTTALWVRANNLPADGRQTIFYLEEGAGSDNDEYRISFGDGNAGNGGKIVFYFENYEADDDYVTCMSPLDYDDNTWHHVIAVRDTDRSCELYIDGNTTPVADESFSGGNNDIDVKDGNEPLRIGWDGTGEYFKGDIDQIFHWNDRELSDTDISDLYNAKFGDTSSVMDLSIYMTTQDGTNNATAIAESFSLNIPFQDAQDIPVSDGDFDADGIWGNYNFTNDDLPEVTLEVGERLNFTVNYVSGLDTYMRIDDNTMLTAPLFSSFLQVPEPTPEFATYYKYDNDEILQIITYNSGPEGSWFQYQGTRAVFQNLDDPNGISYAGLICSLNNTNTNIEHDDNDNKCDSSNGNTGRILNEDRDSIFIPVDNIAYLHFWEIQDRPDQNDSGGNLIPAGTYHLYVFINGYDDTGKSFLRQIDVGRVDVTD